MNKVILLGRLGNDPELRYTQTRVPVCNFSLATNSSVKKNGEWVKTTEWHKIVAWGNIGDAASRNLKKSDQCLVEGRLATKSWEKPDGFKQYSTEIIADKIEYIFNSPNDYNKSEVGAFKPNAETRKQSQEEIDLDNIPF